ncbi:MAG: hypothetical protein AAGF93_04685, partial [Cyanobacteria bacterium P01_H01_bin.105]
MNDWRKRRYLLPLVLCCLLIACSRTPETTETGSSEPRIVEADSENAETISPPTVESAPDSSIL